MIRTFKTKALKEAVEKLPNKTTYDEFKRALMMASGIHSETADRWMEDFVKFDYIKLKGADLEIKITIDDFGF